MGRSSLCLFLALAAVVVVPMLAAGARKGPLVGGWSPIEDLSDPHVKEIAEFAVAEYNKQSKAGLVLKSLVSGETQVVSGTNYRLVLVAAKEAATNRYEAVVWEKSWLHYRNLTSFKPVKA
ncbi:hypothetical protein LWI29_014597 [Acer saccharum]|uniref:Cystatin domain-containing protein n=1 Tax=Acer saccharum TaxID=4024 RepID=A0AA39SN42_ACESA|nr:hypothetical protein LWI29_010541 [Acer saccharum]KAK0596316.1 hypothetical protein LWI29_014597 [Acer saccharum]KAK1560383.1 hypothetical protein Q3G72_026007 [Acer saccharum]